MNGFSFIWVLQCTYMVKSETSDMMQHDFLAILKHPGIIDDIYISIWMQWECRTDLNRHYKPCIHPPKEESNLCCQPIYILKMGPISPRA